MAELFPALFGNAPTKERIGASLIGGRIPHAFIIGGAVGSGKLTLALEIAAALLCESGGKTIPCGSCSVCKRVKERSHTDLKILERARDKATIGVAEVKDFRHDMFLSPSESERKVYIIREADRLTPEAQNSLLIILEEPPKNVFIILLAESLDKLLTTVRSRAQYIPMQRFTTEEIDAYLRDRSPEAARLARTDEKKYRELLTLADGRIGRALSLLTGKEMKSCENEREDAESVIKALYTGVPFSEIYKTMSLLPKQRAELIAIFEDVINALRDTAVLRLVERRELIFFSSSEEASNAAEGIKPRRVGRLIDLFTRATEELSKNVGVQPYLTLLAAEIKTI